MATKKISELSTTTTPSSSALFPIVQSSDNFAVTLTNIAANMPDLTATKVTSSSTITASSGFIGNLTGNVTGDLTGTASAATLALPFPALPRSSGLFPKFVCRALPAIALSCRRLRLRRL